jgi:signal transduction histidine kinase
MAWTTSACLRARPYAWPKSDTHAEARKRAPAEAGGTVVKCRATLTLALALLCLGLLTPFLPASLTTAALLTSGLLLGLLAFRSAPDSQHAQEPLILPKPVVAAPHSRFPQSEIALQQNLQDAAAPVAPIKRPRLTPESRDRSWTELMARVNHDLRTPLNAVVGFSELMILELFGPLGDERYQDYVQHIRDSATDLLKSAEDTLALTALTTHPNRRNGAASCELEHLADDAWTFVSRKAGARAIKFEPNIPANLEIIGEPRTLRQILVNMLSEAVSRAGHGEQVTLNAGVDGEMIELSVSVSRERRMARTKDGSLAICVARTLLEMHGTTLLEINRATGQGWRAVTVLDRAAQPDFFHDRVGRLRESETALAS